MMVKINRRLDARPSCMHAYVVSLSMRQDTFVTSSYRLVAPLDTARTRAES